MSSMSAACITALDYPLTPRCPTPLRPSGLSGSLASSLLESAPSIAAHSLAATPAGLVHPLSSRLWLSLPLDPAPAPTKGRPLLAAGDQSLIVIIPDTTRPLTLSLTLALAPSRWWRNSNSILLTHIQYYYVLRLHPRCFAHGTNVAWVTSLSMLHLNLLLQSRPCSVNLAAPSVATTATSCQRGTEARPQVLSPGFPARPVLAIGMHFRTTWLPTQMPHADPPRSLVCSVHHWPPLH
ncbi:hypothetical protein COCVIDRAFT_36340 [Bipolaris victoriae FI3]|uniref:Uncharacterized protein n=1 Tax=Bipolaris victoriae (strain FI3) TaxID=930091 RepID=W7EXM9_BIPV3|nr:hypothetical protein COCVIDRAFT_36340 [Bipolaris victoriae FI3]